MNERFEVIKFVFQCGTRLIGIGILSGTAYAIVDKLQPIITAWMKERRW